MLHRRSLFALPLLAAPGILHAQGAAPVLRIGTAGREGNYFWAAEQIKGFFPSDLFSRVEIIPTGGSVINMRMMGRGELDVAFCQRDVHSTAGLASSVQLLQTAYDEAVHVVGNTANAADEIKEMAVRGNSIIIDGPDSGTAATWALLTGATKATQDRYKVLKTIPEPSDVDSVARVKSDRATFMLWVAGLNSPGIQGANGSSIATPDRKPALRLLNVNDGDFQAIKGEDGTPLYKPRDITPRPPVAASGKTPGQPGFYNNLLPASSFMGMGSGGVTALVVPCDLMIRREYRDALGRGRLGQLQRAIEAALPNIWARVSPTA